jgi:flagellar biosynthesis protein FlhF
MKHRIHTFRAATMDEAMELVRRELGEEAVVLESKEIAIRRLLPWPAIHQEIEVSTQRASSRKSSASQNRDQKTPSAAPRTIQTLAEKMSATIVEPSAVNTNLEAAVESSEGTNSNTNLLAAPPKWVTPQTNANITSDREKHRPVIARTNLPMPPAVEPVTPTIENIPSPALEPHIASLQLLLAQLVSQTRVGGTTDIPPEYIEHYLRLTTAGIEDGIARDLISRTRRQVLPESNNSAAAIEDMLTAIVEQDIPCVLPISPVPGRREIVTFIGPTGVGKTTTLAKIAGHFALREGRRIGIITIDNYRVGAVEQVRNYADILEVPMRTASNANELRTAIDDLADVDMILIDTAGKSPSDGSKLNELREILQVAASDHILLVLSLAGGASMLPKIAASFGHMLPTSLVLTKLDELATCGCLLSVARHISIPISYVTTGQDVPAQFEPANAARLARLSLGLDKI